MFVVLVYDVGVDRLDRVRKFLRQYLHWVQNSVFEGEITRAEFREIKSKIGDLINQEEDSVRVYKLWDEDYVEKEELGTEQSSTDNIL